MPRPHRPARMPCPPCLAFGAESVRLGPHVSVPSCHAPWRPQAVGLTPLGAAPEQCWCCCRGAGWGLPTALGHPVVHSLLCACSGGARLVALQPSPAAAGWSGACSDTPCGVTGKQGVVPAVGTAGRQLSGVWMQRACLGWQQLGVACVPPSAVPSIEGGLCQRQAGFVRLLPHMARVWRCCACSGCPAPGHGQQPALCWCVSATWGGGHMSPAGRWVLKQQEGPVSRLGVLRRQLWVGCCRREWPGHLFCVVTGACAAQHGCLAGGLCACENIR